jgi:hypothetical protein
MAEPIDIIVPMIREMRADINQRFDGVDRRLDSVEATEKSFKQALIGDSLLSKLVTGRFDLRIEAREQKVRALEVQQ